MYELEIDIQTADGLMDTFNPAEDDHLSMVLFLMDSPESEKSA